ncbi:hypothetical protein LIER_34952 [Lithospermum erythrorhizon]|uniref:non-specific serine/threonine protein kinase n=1 Tax=Lithospermum erythrorhizon TaxID=34254 RepID=A0AAV3NJ95_LITER
MAFCETNLLSFALVFMFLTPTFVASSHNLSQRRQASILLSLKQNFQDVERSLSSWKDSNSMSICTWTGIECDENQLVTSLDISNFNLSGFVSPEITKLHTLVNLSVSGNSFSGIFPSEIIKISSLRYLNISSNMFNGTLNWDFSQLKELQVLDAYDNAFSGPLPSGINKTAVPKLKHLDLGGNYFSGIIPPVFGGLNQLEFLSLAGNDLRGFIPAELGNLTNLKWLRLGYFNQFDGAVPPEIGKLSNLVHLDIGSCGLKGPIPRDLGNLKKLDTLFLQANQLNGSLPPELGNMSSLASLDLSINNLTGAVPSEFSQLKELTLLNLFINNFHGVIPEFIAYLPKLQVLKLWRNRFSGSIPSELGGNGKLIELDLSTNKLTGELPGSLCFGNRLQILILFDNFLLGNLPDGLGKCKSLSRIRLGQNYLSGSIPEGFLYLPELSLVELQNNYFTGKFQESRNVSSSKLEVLILSNNHLSGSIPNSIGKYSGMKILFLDGNHFTGAIPSEIGELENIIKLDMSRNNLSGTIPQEVSDCSSLTFLDLSKNQLEGPIPPEISQIHILNYLNVSCNHLNQSLPKEIGSMKSLTSADFSFNNFTGSVPANGQFLFFNSTSFLGNPTLCVPYLSICNNSVPATIDELHSSGERKSRVPAKYKLVFALALLICSLIFAILAMIKTRKTGKHPKSWKLTAFQKLEFGTEDILESLKDENIIGRGGAGVVYKGIMPNGEQIAVKKLGIGKGSHDDSGLSAEIQTLGKIRHRYIVRLLAFCSNKETNLLVYEYMPNGSLGEVIHHRECEKNNGTVHLKWDVRLKIAIEAAKGLSYLHHDCSPLIIHRDVKSNNILLSSDFEAHVADFGLAKFLQGGVNGASECMSAIAGSYGYIAPEYAYTLKVDEKSDVYSFGVVLMELITGKKPVGDFGEDGMDIVQWAKRETNARKECVVKVLDNRLKNVPFNEAMQVFFVAILCVQDQSVERPTMREVVQMLAQAKQPNTFQLH